MMHHNPNFVRRMEEDRRRDVARRRLPADAGEVERTMLAAASFSGWTSSGWIWTKLMERFCALVRGVGRRTPRRSGGTPRLRS
jgi:hypothetical protein